MKYPSSFIYHYHYRLLGLTEGLFKHASKLPLIIILGVIFSVLFLNIAKVNKHIDAHFFNRGGYLIGMENRLPKPKFSLEKLFSGQYQKEVEAWLNLHVPLRAVAIRGFNQFYFSVFSASYMNQRGIIVGKNEEIYDKRPMYAYCNLNNVAYTTNSFQPLVQNLTTLKHFFNQRNQQFFYYLSPSKVSLYPENLPADYPCHVAVKRPSYLFATEALKENQIPFADTIQALSMKKEKYGPLLFPRGGLHWTELGAAVAAKALISHINETSHLDIPQFTFQYTTSYSPVPEQWDLLALTNISAPNTHYIVPQIQVNAPMGNKKPLRLAIVGTSFNFNLAKVLMKTQLFEQIDFYFYYHMAHYRYQGEKEERFSIEPNDNHAYDDLYSADIVFVEENEFEINAFQTHLLLQGILNK